MKTICLNMIVKNESRVIRRCLASVKELIDYWVIVDTGSTDGTQAIIREFLKDIPGELHERPWVNFGHNRNEALALSKNKGDYLLFIDADEELVFSKPIVKSKLDKDSYIAELWSEECRGKRILLISNRVDWKWEGVLHELPVSSKAKTSETLSEVYTLTHTSESHRSQDPAKYLKDAQILENALKKDPHNSRYVFYLAQSHNCAKNYPMAFKYYEKRAAMGGWEEEVFWSLYMMGEIQEYLEMPASVIIDAYCKAYHYRPSRAEPLYKLAEYFKRQGHFILGYATAKAGLSIPLSKDAVFVLHDVYDFHLLCSLAENAYQLKKYEEAHETLQKILAKPRLPDGLRTTIRQNFTALESYLRTNRKHA